MFLCLSVWRKLNITSRTRLNTSIPSIKGDSIEGDSIFGAEVLIYAARKEETKALDAEISCKSHVFVGVTNNSPHSKTCASDSWELSLSSTI